MPNLNSYVSPASTATNVPTTTETVVASLTIPSVPGPGIPVSLTGTVHLTTGTGTTSVTLRVRRGGLTGSVVATAPADTAIGAAGSTDPYTIQAPDAPPESVNLVYVLTVQQAGASGAGTGVLGVLSATVGQ